MILTDREIHEYLRDGKLSIQPLSIDQIQQNGVDFILDAIESSHIYCGDLILGSSREYIKMPNNLMAFVGIRSTWARQGFGMSGFTVIDAGFEGQVTLEIFWNRPRNYEAAGKILPLGERFAHIIFAKTLSEATPYKGKYQGQVGITKAR